MRQVPWITAKGIKKIMSLMGMEIECVPSNTQHVQTIVKQNGEIIYNEVQHTESTKLFPLPMPHFCKMHVQQLRQCRAIRMAYHDLKGMKLITPFDLISMPVEQIHSITIKRPDNGN